ncbi:MAG: hypothetical protein JWR26_3079 [Pedosphaera sp.]|nr:hypothetical protein [Pedosphaera sp.]
MNARIIKEARTLMPAMVVTLLFSVAPLMIWGHQATRYGFFPLALGFFFMGAISFGNEFQHRTIHLLLTQPVARATVWREKMMVLGVGMGIGLLIYIFGLLIFDANILGEADAPIAALVVMLTTLCAFCTIPFWTLVSRNTLAGVVFSIAIPCAILLANFLLLIEFEMRHFPDGPRLSDLSAIALIGVYSFVFYWLGYFRFRNLQVMDGGSQELSLPTWLETAILKPSKAMGSRFTGHFATLLKKELRLQQLSFIAAGMLCLLVGIVVATSQRRHSDNVRLILGMTFMIYAWFVPLISGAVSVAEEKGWGMADWHRTLPPSTLMQWMAKMLVAFSTSLGLGLVLPGALILICVPEMGFDVKDVSLPSVSEILVLVSGQILVTSLAIYGACLSSNTLRAIFMALGMVAAGLFSIWVGSKLASVYTDLGFPVALGWSSTSLEQHYFLMLLGPVVALLCLTGLIQWFAFRCHRERQVGKGTIAIQLVVWMFAVCSIIAVSIVVLSPIRLNNSQ